ncbi:SIR2 family protein [Polyangium jinanense]|uniref:SIR2 family protein n=1 Tax=Polyangium jinanense TaxID=2829994 RepID=A0A9X3X120_9BACT|nr:SIR2 family protein [Polyangium jinanense]MDC3953453.1 SIR2 family protein [Polyangium jinanense]MDC3979426.1 SIR2 family protein [Polyangium jinanense]
MDQGLTDFLRDYVDALERGSAALFVGAGLSMAAGLPGWGKLLDGMAREIGLDVGKEHDLVLLAQFYVNRQAGSRSYLESLVRRTFDREVGIPDNHRILARLPIGHVWTTNYDEILEGAWRQAGKSFDVKSRSVDLTTSDPEADAVLFKMHGTASQPSEIVLTKDDYELYPRARPGFLELLGTDLTTRTFLFLGLSFTDPNLGHVLSVLRRSFEDGARRHYAILKRPSDPYDAQRFDHHVMDLNRYGIRALVVNDYAEITNVLRKLERRRAQRSVFVSGSFPEDGDEKERAFVTTIARGVGRIVGARNLRLVTGLGRVVGSAAVTGLVEALDGRTAAAISRRLVVRPVREVVPPGASLEAWKRKSREDLLAQAGVMIVIGGLRRGAPAPGVLEEFEIAKTQGLVVLPIAATGHAAQVIHEKMRANPAAHLPAEIDATSFDALGAEAKDEGAILAAIERCLSRLAT